jgi:WD40 repeat protein
MRVFLSYSSRDRAVAETLVSALRAARPSLDIFFDQHALALGGFWMPRLHEEVERADAFVFLFGDKLGPWQAVEYYGAFDRRAKRQSLPIAPVLLRDGGVPGLPFFNQLHWIKSDPASPDAVGRILASLDGASEAPAQDLWRLVNPYRGLQALREDDAALLHGRDELVAQVLQHIAASSPKVAIAVGNSGVGKSSLVYAGVFASLARQNWINDGANGAWPAGLADSRSWLRLALKPSGKGGGSDNPLRELARTFIGQWRDATKADYHADVDAWTARLDGARQPIDELIHASDSWAEAQGLPSPKKYVLYIDQAEELYTRVDRRAAEAFSRVLSQAAQHERVRVLMSLRADFYGKLQDDAALFAASEKIDIPKLDDKGFQAVVTKPARTLGAAFEEGLDEQLVRAAAAQPVGLPLLSYQLTETWNEMVARGDGTLRWPKRTDTGFDLSRALVDRADGYLKANPAREDAVRRLFCVRLVHVPEQGAPTRRVALQEELTAEEQIAAQDLSSPDYRLLAAGETDTGKPSIEVGHEALLTAWERLRNWIVDRRGFYAWRTRLEGDRKEWERVGRPKNGLLVGRALEIAQSYVANYPADIPATETAYIAQSADAAAQAQHTRNLIRAGAFAALLIALVTVSWLGIEAGRQRDAALMAQSRFLAQQAAAVTPNGDPETGLMLALEALPRSLSSPDRPYSSEAMTELLRVWPVLKTQDLTHLWNVASFGSKISSDGSTAITSHTGGLVRLWDAKSGLPKGSPLRPNGLSDLAVNADASRIVTVREARVQMWDGRTGREVGGAVDLGQVIQSVQLTPDGSRIVVATKGHLSLLEFGTGRPIGRRMSNVEFYNRAVPVSPDGRMLLTSADKAVQRWDTTTGTAIGQELRSDDQLRGVLFDPIGTRLLMGTDRGIRLWDPATGVAVGKGVECDRGRNADPAGGVNFSFSAGGRWVLLHCGQLASSWLYVIDAKTAEVVATLSLPRGTIATKAAGSMFWAETERDLYRWTLSASGFTPGPRLEDHRIDASPDGRVLLLHSLSRDYEVLNLSTLWDTVSGKKVGSPLLATGAVWDRGGKRFFVSSTDSAAAVDFSGVTSHATALWAYTERTFVNPMRTQVLAVGADVQLIDLVSRTRRWRSTPRFERTNGAVWDEASSRILSWGKQEVIIWDAMSGAARKVQVPLPREQVISDASFLGSQSRFFSALSTKLGTSSSMMWIGDADQGVLVGRTDRPIETSGGVVKSSGDLLLHRMNENTLELRSISTSSPLGTTKVNGWDEFGFFKQRPFSLTGGRFEVWNDKLEVATLVADNVSSFVLSDRWAALAINNKDTTGVDLFDGTHRRHLTVVDGQVNSLEFSPDGRRLLTVRDDGVVQIWDTQSGKKIGGDGRHRFFGYGGPTSMFAAGGTRILTVPEAGLIQVWDGDFAPIGEPIRCEGDCKLSEDGEFIVLQSIGQATIRSLRTGIEFPVAAQSGRLGGFLAGAGAIGDETWFSKRDGGLMLAIGGSGYFLPMPPRCQELIDWAWSVAEARRLELTQEQRKKFALPAKAERRSTWGIMSFLGRLLPSTGEVCH